MTLKVFEQLTRRIAILLAPISLHCPHEGGPHRHNLTASIVIARPPIPATTTTTATTIIIIIIIIINNDVLLGTNIFANISKTFLVLNIQKMTGHVEQVIQLWTTLRRKTHIGFRIFSFN